MTDQPAPPPNEDERRLLERLTQGIAQRDRTFFDGLTPHEQQNALAILRELRAAGAAPSLDTLWEIDYERRPLAVPQFFGDPVYCGEFLHKNLYDVWRHDIQLVIEQQKVEWILTGSIGAGKTTAAIALLLYVLHRLLCMHDPCGFYKQSSIVFSAFSILKSLSDSVEYELVTKFLLESEFFRSQSVVDEEANRRKPQNAIISFPKGLRFAFGSRSVHALGQNSVAGLLDEVAFSGGVEGKHMVELYNAIKRRMESRFLDSKGSNPGIMCLVSSANMEGDFLDRHIKESLNKENHHISSYALWDVKRFDGPRFRLQVGDMIHSSQILDEVSADGQVVREVLAPTEGARVIQVPTMLRDKFESDIEGAIRDFAGISLFTSTPFIPHRERIREAIVSDLKHPFTIAEPHINIRSDVELEHIFLKDVLFHCVDPFRDIWHITRHPTAPRFVHIDPALKHDSLGLAICHLAGVREIWRTDNEGKPFSELAPVVEFDLLLRVPPTPGSEIDLAKLQSFIFFLIRMGMPIRLVTYDQFQSAGAIQTFTKASIESKRVSVDITPEQYLALKEAIMEQRVRYYAYEPFIRELTMLQRIDTRPTRAVILRRRFRVDHPANGSKDVADAAAAACWSCVTSKHSASQIASLRAIDGIESLTTKPPLPANPRLNQPSASWIVRDHDEGDAIARLLDGGL